MSTKKTKTTAAKKSTAKAGAPTRKQQAAAEASAQKLARLEASDPGGKAPETQAVDKEAKPAATRKAKAAKPERMSAIDAAAKVLKEAGSP